MILQLRQFILLIFFAFISTLSLSDILIQVDDDAEEGFNDPTYGSSRLQTFEQAAAILSTYLDSQVDITVLARFDELTCTPTSATLGSASPNSTAYNFKNAPYKDTLYPIALANAIAQEDLEPTEADIIAVFNSKLDSGDCLGGSTWYYGYDEAPTRTVSLLEVVLHELIHGLGFISTVSEDGSRLFYQWVDGNGNVLETVYLDDPFIMHLENGIGENWGNLDGTSDQSGNLTRQQDAISDDLYFSGPNTNQALQDKTGGIVNGLVKMYAPSTYNSASNVSHFDTSLSPNEVMEPFNTGNSDGIGLAFYVLKDIGWPSINIPPIITGQNAISTEEDTPFSILYADILVEDSDSQYPKEFMLKIFNADNFDYFNGEITPQKDFTGTLKINISVNDGKDESNTYELLIDVTEVNDPPEIINQNAISVNEDSTLILDISHFNIYDPDSTSLQIIALPGENYQVTNNQITPNANFNGDLRINVQATDGQSTSEIYEASVAVVAVNDAPTFKTGDHFLATIDQSFSLLLEVFDVDENYIIYQASNTPRWMILNNDTLNGTPTISDLGTYTINIRASDGTETISKDITVTVLENNQVDFAITPTRQNLLSTLNNSNSLSFEISGSGQSRKEAITIEFTSEMELTNDLCDAITNGLSCQYSLMNTTDSFFISAKATQLGSYKINAAITQLPDNVDDTDLSNQSSAIWLSIIEENTDILAPINETQFESQIASITSDEKSHTIALGFNDKENQLLNADDSGHYALMAKFAKTHPTHNIDLIDVNNDDTLDLIATSNNQSAEVYLNISNELIFSESFSQLPIESISQTAVIKNGVYVIANNETMYILQSNLADSFTVHSQFNIDNINHIQVADINQNDSNDLIITTSDNMLYIYNALAGSTEDDENDSQILFDSTSTSYTLSQTTTAHAANFEQSTYILQGDDSGLNILNMKNNTLSLVKKINTGQVKDVSSIDDEGVFYVLNESGSIFTYQFEQSEATLLSSMHTSFADKVVYLPIDSEKFALWATHEKSISVFNVELPFVESSITDTQTATESQTDTDTSTATQTSTDTNTDSNTDTDASTLISDTADNKTENVKIGQINYAWLLLLFGMMLMIRKQRVFI